MPARAQEDPLEVVADRLHSAAIHLLRAARRDDESFGLSAARLSALSVVVFGGPLPLGALALAEQVRPPTMTRLVQGLERSGLVGRVPDPGDGRVSLVRSTQRGERLLQAARRRRIEAIAEILGDVGSADLGTLAAAADILERKVAARRTSGDGVAPGPRARRRR